MQGDADTPRRARVSLVTTVFNEAESISAWLESVRGQTRTPEEFIVVDAGSQDGTIEILRAAAQDDPSMRVVVAPGLNISEGRNRAIAEATGSVIAVTDAGTRLATDWLERLTEPFDEGPVDVVSGFFEPAGRNRFERILAAVITPRLDEIDPDSFLPSSRSVAFRREAWEKVGGYPTWLIVCEDLIFDMDLRAAGARFHFEPDARVSWYPRPTLRAFFRQYRAYARGDGHAGIFWRRHTLRYLAYAAGIALAGMAPRRRWAGLALGVGAAGYLRKFVIRLWRSPGVDGMQDRLSATPLVPVIVVAGDVAKMLGYPQGAIERLRAGGRDGLQRRAPHTWSPREHVSRDDAARHLVSAS